VLRIVRGTGLNDDDHARVRNRHKGYHRFSKSEYHMFFYIPFGLVTNIREEGESVMETAMETMMMERREDPFKLKVRCVFHFGSEAQDLLRAASLPLLQLAS
jgi:hypothetical protein